jgi:hypothetical protein
MTALRPLEKIFTFIVKSVEQIVNEKTYQKNHLCTQNMQRIFGVMVHSSIRYFSPTITRMSETGAVSPTGTMSDT